MHPETCALHANDGTKTCSGTLKKGGTCAYKVAGPPVLGMMPTCKIHQDQLKVSGLCRAQLPCGFKCGRIFEWKPCGFQLCPVHRECLMACYFLKMPTEMRLRVYRFLLPDRPIPARYSNSKAFTSDGEQLYMAILRVNHQIHDEAASLLYSNTTFTIELSENFLSMCNSAEKFAQYGFSSRGNHALQDYQMQLMLLEQQNKKRLMMARQEQGNGSGESSSTRPPVSQYIQLHNDAPVPDEHTSIGPIWNPRLSERYFDMIRSFIVKFVFPSSRRQNPANNYAHGSSNADAANYATELRLYDYCDNLHSIIGRLQLIQRPLAHLEIVIEFGHTYIERDDAFSAMQLLLQPFRRLRNVAKPEVLSITMRDILDREIKLLIPDEIFSTADTTFVDYVKCWSNSLSSSEPSLESPQVFEAYWQLEKLLSSIKRHFNYSNPNFSKFTGLLHGARIAREAENITRFREIWEQVINIWFDDLNSQEAFQSKVARSIGEINDMVGN